MLCVELTLEWLAMNGLTFQVARTSVLFWASLSCTSYFGNWKTEKLKGESDPYIMRCECVDAWSSKNVTWRTSTAICLFSSFGVHPVAGSSTRHFGRSRGGF
jgi:hypothetical protein